MLGGLIEKGIVKAKRVKNHPEKIRWRYILTPKGIKVKTSIARKYLEKRIIEFESMKREIDELRKEM